MSHSHSTAPLGGKRIVITRPEGQGDSLRTSLEKHGATVLELPLLNIEFLAATETLREVFAEMGQYDWIVFTSANGVEGFFDRFFENFKDIRGLGLSRIACVGPATARAVEALHLQVDIRPEDGTGEALARAMVTTENLEHLRVLVVTGNRNRDTLVNILSGEGRAIVDTLPVYETHENEVDHLEAAAAFRQHGADAIIFASPSAVSAFIAQARQLRPGKGAIQPKAVAIGSITAGAMRESGIPVAAQASHPTPEDITQAVLRALQ